MKDRIDHQGVIESIEGNHIRVSILQSAACSQCKAKSMCTSSETKERFIDVLNADPTKYRVGQSVVVCASLSMGRKAVRLAFGFPLLITVLIAILSGIILSLPESLTLIIILMVNTLYFTIIYFLRERLSKEFAFWIK